MSLPVSPNYTEYNPTTGITANGTFAVGAAFVGTDYAFYVAGSFGGGSVTFGYIDAAGEFAPFKNLSGDDIVATASNGVIVPSPPSKILAVKLLGSSTPLIKMSYILHNR